MFDRPRRRLPMPAAVRRLRMAPDTRSRHRWIAELAGSPESLLDVGGSPGELALFMPRTRIVTANIEPGADVIFDGVSLPFGDGEFEVAASVDVLEHVPRQLRRRHVSELARVARERVVLCCPLGSPHHEEAERELADWHERTTGRRHRFLDEHLERGLPDEAELRELARGSLLQPTLLYGGNFAEANAIFRLVTDLKRRPTPTRVLRYLKSSLLRGREGPLAEEATPLTNRAFLTGAPGGEARSAADPATRP